MNVLKAALSPKKRFEADATITRVIIASVFGLAALAASCSSGEGKDGNRAIADALPPGVPVEHLLADADDAQVELFRDGVIDFADYERATLAFLACMDDAGFPTKSGPTFDEAMQRFDVEFTARPGAELEPDTQLNCAKRHNFYVQMAWAWEHSPSEQDLQAAKQAVGACLRDAGYDFVPDVPNFLDYDQVRSAGGDSDVAECVQKAGEQFKIPSFGG